MRFLKTICWALFFAAGACLGPPPAEMTSGPEDSEETIVLLNGEAVTRWEWNKFLERTGRDSDRPGRVKPVLFKEFLVQKLLLQGALRKGITVEEEEITAHLESWAPEEAQKNEEARQGVRELLTSQKYARSAVPHAEVTLQQVLDYYEEHADEFISEDQLLVLEILVEKRGQAEELLRQLKGADSRRFRELARRHSVGVTAHRGGELGYFKRGDLPTEFERIVFDLEGAEISNVFASPRGFHVFMVEERIERHAQKFYEVRDQIFEKLVAEQERKALEDFVNQILKNASIEIRDPEFQDYLQET